MLEGSGGTSADSSGNGHTLTLDGTVTWTTIGGEAALAFSGTAAHAAAITSPPAMGDTANWSLAWRGKQTTSGAAGVFTGDEAGGVVWMFGTVELDYKSIGGAADYPFTSETVFTSDHNWLLAVDHTNGAIHLYKDGTEVSGSPLLSAGLFGLTFKDIGAGYDNAGGFALVGTMTYAYLMAGYVATGTDATNLVEVGVGVFLHRKAVSIPKLYDALLSIKGSCLCLNTRFSTDPSQRLPHNWQ